MSNQAHAAKIAFGARLREIRKDANLSGRALASKSGLHHTKVSRLEHGRQNPSEDDIRAWCRACDSEDQVPELIATHRNIEQMWLEWRRQMRGGMKRLQASATPLYEETKLLRVYESICVPGILQTAGYCTAIMNIASTFYRTAHDVDEAAKARLERQPLLYRGDHQFAFVLESWALQANFGGAEVMLGQLDFLLSAMTFAERVSRDHPSQHRETDVARRGVLYLR